MCPLTTGIHFKGTLRQKEIGANLRNLRTKK